MLDSEQNETHVAWGTPVLRQANGRLQWPVAIKDEAVERILGGETVVSIATEIGANPSLVAKWVSAVRDAAVASKEVPSFVEVVVTGELAPAAASITENTITSCELFLGDVRLVISPNYPAFHLTEILRAVRAI